MNPNEEIRIAVAKACGWKPYAPITNDGWPLLMTPPGKPVKEGWLEPIPNYPECLNAMHEAERTLTEEGHYQYARELERLVASVGRCRPHLATARQRAEAFLRTLGLWKD